MGHKFMKSNIYSHPSVYQTLTFTLNGDEGSFQIVFSKDGLTHNFPTDSKAAKGVFECLKSSWKGWFDSYVKVNSDKLTEFTINDYNRLLIENEKLKRFIEKRDLALAFDYMERMEKEEDKRQKHNDQIKANLNKTDENESDKNQ